MIKDRFIYQPQVPDWDSLKEIKFLGMLHSKLYVQRHLQYQLCTHTHTLPNQEIPLILHSQDSDAFIR